MVFQFCHHKELERVLASGPYFIYGRALLLRLILENLCFQEEDYSIVPIWVQFHNLPLQCWNTRAISKIASKLGKPLCVDNFTLERKRISYARVLIEIDTSISPLEMFDVKLPSGLVYSQYVYYENMPKFCNHCFMFGHIREKCKHLVNYEIPNVQLKKKTPPTEDLGSKPSDDMIKSNQMKQAETSSDTPPPPSLQKIWIPLKLIRFLILQIRQRIWIVKIMWWCKL